MDPFETFSIFKIVEHIHGPAKIKQKGSFGNVCQRVQSLHCRRAPYVLSWAAWKADSL